VLTGIALPSCLIARVIFCGLSNWCPRAFLAASASLLSFAFVLGEHSKNPHGQNIGIGHITVGELPTLHGAKMKPALRLSRSSLAMSSVLPTRRASAIAASSRGSWLFAALHFDVLRQPLS
jgi:hypothetical protein